MLLNADFSRRVVIDTGSQPWVPSPQAGVERRMLDRIGDEKARATSIVRYAPASSYPAHPHPGGEEIFVLSGTFVDDGTPHPAGSYLRNPPGSAHQPASPEGAVIFVKLWQMDEAEREAVRIDTRGPSLWRRGLDRSVCPLFDGFGEQVCIVKLDARAPLLTENDAGAEVLLLDGTLCERWPDAAERAHANPLASGSWLRLPPGDGLHLEAGDQGARLYLKTGHLIRPSKDASRC